MKKIKIFASITLIVLLFSLQGCDYLDYNEEDWLEEEDVYKTTLDRLDNSLTAVYSYLPSGFNEVGGAMRSSASDDAEEENVLSSIQAMNDGRWSALRTVDEMWTSSYRGIRYANQLLKNYDVSILEDIRYSDNYQEDLARIEIIDEEARFLRAYLYFELIRRYGDVPLLKGEVLTLENVNSIQRAPFDDVVDFIVQECDAIVDALPEKIGDILGMRENDSKGRATKGAVMALKARTLLYAASPLNGSTQEKWELAAKAAHDIIASGTYGMENKYVDIVNNSKSKELILGSREASNNSFESRNFPIGYEGARIGGTNPTQNLVNTYKMRTGKDIDDPDSGYDPQNPYANRDPRLEQTIIVNNSSWKGRKVEIWRDGLDGLPIQGATKTGYYLKKYVNENISLDPNSTTSSFHVWVIFRYGEVLLNYAEAMNEAYGPTSLGDGYFLSAYTAVNFIRGRARMQGFEPNLSKEDFREELRKERRVELAFENHRFWDVRRWQIGDQTTDIKGVEITQNPDLTLNYNEVLIETRPWDPKMNRYPIPQTEIFINNNLSQNTGW